MWRTPEMVNSAAKVVETPFMGCSRNPGMSTLGVISYRGIRERMSAYRCDAFSVVATEDRELDTKLQLRRWLIMVQKSLDTLGICKAGEHVTILTSPELSALSSRANKCLDQFEDSIKKRRRD